jgi:hypothetical protein
MRTFREIERLCVFRLGTVIFYVILRLFNISREGKERKLDEPRRPLKKKVVYGVHF